MGGGCAGDKARAGGVLLGLGLNADLTH